MDLHQSRVINSGIVYESTCVVTEEENLRKQFSSTPLNAVSFTTQQILCNGLDRLKIIPSPNGLPRDYRGLSELACITYEMISHKNPTLSVFKAWCMRIPNLTIQDLINCLQVLDRWDIIQDLEDTLSKDCLDYCHQESQLVITHRSLEDPLTSSNVIITPVEERFDLISEHTTNGASNNGIQSIETGNNGVPVDLQMSPAARKKYDAFILYSEADVYIAQQIVYHLEHHFNLRICVKDRDIMPGADFEHEIMNYLISEICSRLLVIITPNFLNSSSEKFVYKYNMALSIREKKKKIIPCLCELSQDEEINKRLFKATYFYFTVDLTKRNPFISNWKRLRDAITSTSFGHEGCTRAIEFNGVLSNQKHNSHNMMSLYEPMNANLKAVSENNGPVSENKFPAIADVTTAGNNIVSLPGQSKKISETDNVELLEINEHSKAGNHLGTASDNITREQGTIINNLTPKENNVLTNGINLSGQNNQILSSNSRRKFSLKYFLCFKKRR